MWLEASVRTSRHHLPSSTSDFCKTLEHTEERGWGQLGRVVSHCGLHRETHKGYAMFISLFPLDSSHWQHIL